MNQFHSKMVIPIIVIIIAVLGIGLFAANKGAQAPVQSLAVTSFEECAAAGNPVMESYPRQCAADGVTYTEVIAENPVTVVTVTSTTTATTTVTSTTTVPSSAEPEQVFCTMDAKMCPDGSYVGRQGPKCEFAPCPGN